MNPPSLGRQFHIVPTDTTLTYRFNRSNSTETLLILTAQKTGVFRQFRRILVCFGGKLVSGWYKMNEFFFFFFPEYFWYLHIFIFGVLDDHDSPNFSLPDHPSLLLPPFNRPNCSGELSFFFLFSFQRATPYFLYILERQSHFILKLVANPCDARDS